MHKPILAQSLAYAGTLPFIGAVAASIFNIDVPGVNLDQMIITYGAVIASFVAGTHWGIYLCKDVKINLFIHSNIATLLAWTVPAFSLPLGELILILCFAYLWIIDFKLYRDGWHIRWYIVMRTIVSAIVITTLVIYLIFQLI